MATEILIKSLVAFIFFLPLSYKYLTPNEKHEKIFLLISAILFIVPVQAQHTLKLMTYNIRNATGMDGVCNFSVLQM